MVCVISEEYLLAFPYPLTAFSQALVLPSSKTKTAFGSSLWSMKFDQ